jgi:hypothetical protein
MESSSRGSIPMRNLCISIVAPFQAIVQNPLEPTQNDITFNLTKLFAVDESEKIRENALKKVELTPKIIYFVISKTRDVNS